MWKRGRDWLYFIDPIATITIDTAVFRDFPPVDEMVATAEKLLAERKNKT